MSSIRAVVLACVLLVPPLAAAPSYGFRGFEIYKLDRSIGLLTAADVDGDGLTDLLVANNDRARIEVFLRRKEPVPPSKRTGPAQPNVIRDDRFYERREILTEKQLSSLAAGDLDGDGDLDVAYYGKPEELVVAHGDGKGNFPDQTRFALGDGVGVETGDLDGDGRTDLVLLRKDATAILYQTPKGSLKEPVQLPHTESGVLGVQIADVDGDGRDDLVLATQSDARSLLVRLQRADGSLGPEFALPLRARAFDFVDLDPAPGAEVVAVTRTSGVLRALRLVTRRGEAGAPAAEALGMLEIHAFAEAGKGKPRSMALGDVDGDGRPDVVVTEPALAQVALYAQAEQGGLRGRRVFPSLANADAVRVADLDGAPGAEVVVLSETERAVGISTWKENGLPFPDLLRLPALPKAVDAADVNGDGRADLVVVVEDDKGHRALVYLQREEGGLPEEPLAIELGKKQPLDDLHVADLDQDGRGDLLLFDAYGPLRIWRGVEEGGFTELGADGADYRAGLVQRLAAGNVGRADIDGDGKAELLVASRNFARALVLDAEAGTLEIRDQANAASPRSQVKGAAALDLDGDGTLEIALYDAERNVVTLLGRDEGGVFATLATLPAGGFDYRGMYAEDLDGDGRTDLVLFGKDRFGVFRAGGETRELRELAVVESTVEDAYLGRFDVGELDGDGRPDVVVLDQGRRGVQIFSYAPEEGFTEELHFPVYEMKLHEQRGRTGDLNNIVVEDLDGDGRDDVALLVHDRLIVYLR